MSQEDIIWGRGSQIVRQLVNLKAELEELAEQARRERETRSANLEAGPETVRQCHRYSRLASAAESTARGLQNALNFATDEWPFDAYGVKND